MIVHDRTKHFILNATFPVKSKNIFLKTTKEQIKTTKSSQVTTTNFTEPKPHKIAISYSEMVQFLVSCTKITDK